ncbi:MAG TPA: Ig-like domain-containing protein [Ferruginibacter sp.]|jgi:hypothetical protein|nr:Ig-like domain-containing protein [Ferruginibacter sp.]
MKKRSIDTQRILLNTPGIRPFKMAVNKWLLLFLSIIFVTACHKDQAAIGNNNVGPKIISTNPVNNSTNTDLNRKITAAFNEGMNPFTITAATFVLKQDATIVTGVVTYSGTTAIFSPSSNLLPNKTYTATITTGAKNSTGVALQNNFTWNFTTGISLDIAPPTVMSTDPINNATSVTLDKTIAVTFSKPMDPSTITSTAFVLSQGAKTVLGAVSYTDTTAIFSPAVNLLPNTTYTVTVKTGVKDLAGNALVNNYVWNFTTGKSVSAPVLGSAAVFGSFGGSAGITNQGLNTIINNGGISTTGASTLVTGFHDGTTGDVYTETPLNKGDVTGRIYAAPPAPGNATSLAIAQQGLADATNAYNSISPASKPGGIDPGAGELGGLTLAPGIYKSASGTFKITNGNLTLDAMGDPNAVWIFQTAAGLTVGIAGPTGARSITMINGASPANVFWYIGSAATINGAGGGVMVGTILASAGVSLSTAGNSVQTVLDGRAISLHGSVTMVNTTINVP